MTRNFVRPKCLNGIVLKNGTVVPCGKCELCRSKFRNDWSIRVQIQCKFEYRMPLMLGFDYRPADVPISESGKMVLCRPHISAFIKEYKRKYHLDNDKFHYYGCGEYGSREDCTHRPHYHLIVFGDDELYDLFYRDEQLARERLQVLWKYGRVWIGQAQWSGIHYVTKYVLKDIENQGYEVAPFTIASKGLGSNFFDSPEAIEITKRLQFLAYNRDWIYSNCPRFEFDDIDSLLAAKEYFRQYVPKFEVQLDNGKFVPLPRFFRRKLVGSFQHFMDNSLWLPNWIDELIEHYRLSENKGFQNLREISERKIFKIKQRLLEYNYNKNRPRK